MTSRRLSLFGFALGWAVVVAGCSSDETTATEDHDPVSVTLSVNGVTNPDGKLHLPEGQTVTVRATFLNAAGDNLDDVEGEHFSLLTFTPAGIATATVDPAAHYSQQVVVNAAAPATGTVMVGFGHDALADEHSLGPIDVVVE